VTFRSLVRFLVVTLRERVRSLSGRRAEEERVAIYHDKVIDGFNELTTHENYLSFASNCGICDAPIVVSGKAQKYLLEVRGIPAKMLMRGVVFCGVCRKRRARINWLKSGDRWRTEPNGEAQLAQLRSDEEQSRRSSHRLYEGAIWPY
jgi:hypothetical protein